jgi:DNA repair exonuclease SbcCD ATPase subunit
LQQTHNALHNDYEKLRQTDEKLQRAHNELHQNHATLEQTLAALQRSHDELHDKHQRQTQSQEDLRQSHETLLDDKRQADEALARSNAAVDEHTAALAETNAELAEKLTTLADLEKIHQQLSADHDRQTQAYGELRQSHAELRTSHDALLEVKQQADQALVQATAAIDERDAALAENIAALAEKSAALVALEQIHQELRGEHERQTLDFDELRHSHGDLKSSHDELTQSHFSLTRAYDEVLESKRQAEKALSERISAGIDAGELQELQAEREALISRLADAESTLAKADLQRNDELQRRFELAVEDVRSLKRRNSELEEAVLALKSAGPRAASPANSAPESPNWEATKRRMMESLEADTDSSEERDDERVTIENTILITDDVVAQKDREITEMKLLLSQQSSNIDSAAVGANAISDAINQDELILQERAKLAELQEQWKSKLRQAEIDISVERAKITRDRAEIEEKLAAYEKERSKQAADGGTPGESAGSAKKPTRGRWLARLGLKDGD